jgi:aminoglycoside phosphotransferase (APT) family kinase protein
MAAATLWGSRMDINDALARWAVQEHGPDARVTDVRAMPGNAGLSFGFTLSAEHEQRLVIRLAPPGVRRTGNTDVMRQVPLLRALAEQGRVPVAEVRWAMEDSPIFGTAAFVVDLLDGRPLHMTSPELSYDGDADPWPLIQQAVDVLVAVHATALDGPLADWASETTLEQEIAWALAVSAKGVSGPHVAEAYSLGEALRRTAPKDASIGLFHGDFQTNNILFADGRITGVVDWELAGIGGQLLDLGWLAMMTDIDCWHPDYAEQLLVTAPPAALLERYAATAPTDPRGHFGWFSALACLRFAAIVSYNLRLHREGKRVDRYYETLAPSIPHLLRRGRQHALDAT